MCKRPVCCQIETEENDLSSNIMTKISLVSSCSQARFMMPHLENHETNV